MNRNLLLLVLMAGVVAASTFPLDSAVNISQFKLSSSERELLIRNGFVVALASYEQLFMLYESNWWSGTPSFVTPDLMLQLFHLCISSTLKRIEQDALSADLADFSQRMAVKFNLPDEPRLAAYFGVACRLLGKEVPLGPIPESLCQAELALINGHAGRSASAIFPFMLDYSMFQTRGHYTRNDTLRRYFRAMEWYGTVPFPLEDSSLKPEELRALTQDAVRMSLAVTQDHHLDRIWQEILDVTSFFSGPSEAYTPHEYLTALARLQPNASWASYLDWTVPDTEFMAAFAVELKRGRKQKIHQVAVGIPTGPQFRLFGQRYVPDTDIMQQLVEWPDRPFPKGLDVFAALGSARAKQILSDVYREQEGWAQYPDHLAKAESAFAGRDTTFWYQNVYYAWLYALQALNEPAPKSAPQFMQNPAWQDKCLNTSAGSWSELRHDAILYAEGIMAENGGPESLVGSYAEPNPLFYLRLSHAVKTLEDLLTKRGLESDWLREDLGHLRAILGGLQSISEEELAGVSPTAEDMSFIWDIGDEVERLSCSIADQGYPWSEHAASADRSLACVADIATSQDQCLEEGVAAGNTIYVLVPIEGKWTLTRGAVFSYREFQWPASDRLTDEKWQQMVRDGKAPAPPIWTKSFMAGE